MNHYRFLPTRRRRQLLGWLGGIALALPLHAAPPTLSSLFPAGGQKGTSFTLTTIGKVDPTVRCWTNAPGVSIQPEGKANLWKVNIAPDAPAGLYLVRLYNAEGASSHGWFRVGRLPEIAEVEPNDEIGTGQLLEKLPVCINARLEKAGDVDGYRIALKKGQTLSAHVEAYTLGSKVDVIAHLVNSKGTRVLTASDARNLDPSFTYTVEEDDTYTVQLAGFAHPPQANVAYAGGINLVYRLQLTTGPAVSHVLPQAVMKQGKTEITLQGKNIPPEKAKLEVEPSLIPSHQPFAWLDLPDSFAPIQAVIAAQKPLVEKEPNQKPEEATPIKAGDAIGGHIAEPKDRDFFVVEMKKGERLQATVHARTIGSALDPTLQVLGPDGGNLGLIDDVGAKLDPTFAWTAKADGPHQIIVSDTTRQNGPNHFYVLQVAAPAPGVEAIVNGATAYTLEAGKSLSLKANVKRLNGLNAPLVIRASNLPVGVHADPVEVPEKGGEVEIQLIAAANASPSQQPIQLSVWTKEDPFTSYIATASLRGEELRGTSLLDDTTDLWLTVTVPAAAAAPAPTEKK